MKNTELTTSKVNRLLPQNMNTQRALETRKKYESSIVVQASECQSAVQFLQTVKNANSMDAVNSLGLRFVVKQCPEILENTVEVCVRYVGYLLKGRADFSEMQKYLLSELITDFAQKAGGGGLYIDDVICMIKKGLTGQYGKLYHKELTLDIIGDWFTEYAKEVNMRYEALKQKQKMKHILEVKLTPEQDARITKKLEEFYRRMNDQSDRYDSVSKKDRQMAILARTNLMKFRQTFPERVPLWILQSEMDNPKLSSDVRENLYARIEKAKLDLKQKLAKQEEDAKSVVRSE